MKSVFYSGLLDDYCGLTPAEKIVYSFMVYKSICRLDGVFDKETGQLDTCIVKEEIENCNNILELPYEFYHNGRFEAGGIISESTNVSTGMVSYVLTSLEQKGLLSLRSETIKVKYIEFDRFFELMSGTSDKLRGELLIFYSWLVYLTRNYNGTLKMTKEKIASYYYDGCTLDTIKSLIKRLMKLGFVERDEYRRLILKQ